MNTLDEPSDQAIVDTVQAQPRMVSLLATLTWLKQGWAIYRRDWSIWTVFGWLPAVLILVGGVPSFQFFDRDPVTAWDTFFQVLFQWAWIFIITGIAASCIQGLKKGERLRFIRHFFSNDPMYLKSATLYQVFTLAGVWVIVSYCLDLALNTQVGRQLVDVMSLTIQIEPLPAYLKSYFGTQAPLVIQFYYLLIAPLSLMFCFALLLAGVQGMNGWQALRLSLLGVIKNLIPLLLYVVICAGLLWVVEFAYLIPLLVIAPWLVCSLYSAYRQIYLENSSLDLRINDAPNLPFILR